MIYTVLSVKSEAIFYPVCTVLVHFVEDINRTNLSTTLKTILFANGHITM